ncbi:magnesium/cobalt efflux protein [Aureimonas sp. Leaf454]|uniref:hemolysin family protein n=1 Tax=Aureimonas sp. Leaf454 TaxID=1736381 RepID=UPI0006FC3696|nr:hemolysin family protein [Aureimonas sp. Leaf454]KQT43224.1 magnesium/cobalt efflux protein [Aureimonas sp. Leaf454]
MSELPADTAGEPASNGESGPFEDRSPRAEDRSPRGEERGPRDLAGAGERWGFLANVFGRLKPREPAFSRADLLDAFLEEGGADVFGADERAMLKNILTLRDLRVDDVMVPRAEIDAVSAAMTLSDTMRAFETSGHSRMPVYGETLDDPIGMIHIRDVVGHITRTALGAASANDLDLMRIDLSRPIGDLDLLRKVLFVPPAMPASNLMAKMQATRTQMALVIDEYGGTDGLVSLEDVIEVVFGDIEDEHDAEEALIVERGDGGFVVEARAELSDVRRRIGADFDTTRHEEEADTIGGLLFHALGRVPAKGERLEPVPGFVFEVLDADPRRVRRVAIERRGGREGRMRIA